MNQSNNDPELWTKVFLVFIGLVVLYNFWPIIVGFLAACGVYFLAQEYQKHERNRRR